MLDRPKTSGERPDIRAASGAIADGTSQILIANSMERADGSDVVTADASRTARRAMAACGAIVLLALGAETLLSWLLAPFATYEGRTYGQFEFFSRIAESIPF